MRPGTFSTAAGNRRLFRVIGYGLVFLMMACAALTIAILVQLTAPGWHSAIIAAALLFIVIDRLYTYRQLKSMALLSSEWVVAVGVQWIVIALVIRLLLSYAGGGEALRADLALLARGEIAALFSLEYVITLIFAFVFWILPAQFLQLLDEIGLDQELAEREESPPLQSDAAPAHQRLMNLVFGLGIALVILTALTRLDLRNILATTGGLPEIEISRFSGAEAGALLYFVFGLTLLSLSRLMSLLTHWNRLRIPVSSANLVRQWGIYSLGFLLALGLVVSLLPAGDSLGLASVIGSLFGFVFGVLAFLAQLLVAVVLYLFSLPFLMFGSTPPLLSEGSAPPLPTLPTQPQLPAAANPLWETVRSVVLWGGLIAIVVFSAVQYVRQHGGVRAALRGSRLGNWLVLAWQWLYRSIGRTGGAVSRVLAEGWQSLVARLEGKRLPAPPGWMRPRGLDPRQQIYFFYLAMIRRGGEQGLARRPSQTPAEYAAALEQAVPEAGEDIGSMTGAFVEARYSPRAVDAGQAHRVRETWGRIRRALQERVRRSRADRG